MGASAINLPQLIERYGNQLWQGGQHKATAMGYLYEIAEIKKAPFTVFRSTDFDEIIAELKKRKNKNSTINRKIFALTKLLRAAVEEGVIPNVPVFKRLQENTSLRYLSDSEEKKLIAAIADKSESFAALTSFLLDTGMTLGEAIALRWESIVAGEVRVVESPMGAGRTLPLTERASRSVRTMVSEPRGPFSRILQPKYRAVWNEAKHDIGLGHDQAIVPTILRHTCACRLVIQGLDLSLIQRWLGNRNYKSMIRYEELSPQDNFDLCVSALERF